MVALGSSLRVGDPEAQMSNLPGFLCSHSSWHSPQCAAHRHGGHALRAHRAADDSFLGPHARRPGFLRAVARAIADFASRSANIGKTKRRIMKTTLLLTALLCGSAQANDITIDIWRPPDLNEYGNPDPGGIPTVFVGSYTMPGSPFSPELNFHADTLDWRPF